jgi:protein TonB
MSSANTLNVNYPTFNPVAQQKKSRLVAGLLLTVVVGLHIALAWYLLSATATEPKKPLVVMEVVMLKPEPVLKQAPKEPAPAPPPVKKEPIKPKAVVTPPKPVKKPVPVPKPQPAEIKEVTLPKFEPVPMPVPATTPSAASTSSTTAKTSTAAGQGSNDNKTVVSGVVALLRVPPKYPARAANRHIEGWVTVEFTVQTDGSVDDAVVVNSEPEGVFDEAALTAISKWQFKEKIVNGVAVTQRAVQKLQFKLEH